MKRLVALSLALGVLLTTALPVEANEQFIRVSRPSSLNECRVVRLRHLISNSTPCSAVLTRTAWGAAIARTYRTNPVVSFTAPPPLASYASYGTMCQWWQYRCQNFPLGNGAYKYIDSFEVQRGPFGLWQVSIRYHIKSNGVNVIQTAKPDCNFTAIGYTISITSCEMQKIDTARGPVWEIGVRWKECYSSSSWGFCNTKGLTLKTDAWHFTERKTW